MNIRKLTKIFHTKKIIETAKLIYRSTFFFNAISTVLLLGLFN